MGFWWVVGRAATGWASSCSARRGFGRALVAWMGLSLLGRYRHRARAPRQTSPRAAARRPAGRGPAGRAGGGVGGRRRWRAGRRRRGGRRRGRGEREGCGGGETGSGSGKGGGEAGGEGGSGGETGGGGGKGGSTRRLQPTAAAQLGPPPNPRLLIVDLSFQTSRTSSYARATRLCERRGCRGRVGRLAQPHTRTQGRGETSWIPRHGMSQNSVRASL